LNLVGVPEFVFKIINAGVFNKKERRKPKVKIAKKKKKVKKKKGKKGKKGEPEEFEEEEPEIEEIQPGEVVPKEKAFEDLPEDFKNKLFPF
jgi:hypothetical protein